MPLGSGTDSTFFITITAYPLTPVNEDPISRDVFTHPTFVVIDTTSSLDLSILSRKIRKSFNSVSKSFIWK